MYFKVVRSSPGLGSLRAKYCPFRYLLLRSNRQHGNFIWRNIGRHSILIRTAVRISSKVHTYEEAPEGTRSSFEPRVRMAVPSRHARRQPSRSTPLGGQLPSATPLTTRSVPPRDESPTCRGGLQPPFAKHHLGWQQVGDKSHRLAGYHLPNIDNKASIVYYVYIKSHISMTYHI